MNIKEQLVDECIDIIKRGDVKTEIKNMFKPIIGMLLSILKSKKPSSEKNNALKIALIKVFPLFG